ncbi:hypothetical protein [Streptomyces sp. NBC_01012]|uniref:hypothetical protein n=1 Tax=Streptomyces sp. NBC_01012 TaxID=2903717 RepID=UPI00386C292F|nr:hypothetical protein OG623_03790 [Streptomyces sp. NBC_01012]
MAKISRSVKKTAEGFGYSLELQRLGGDDLVMVYKGSVLRGQPVGKAISGALGQWQAMGTDPRTTATKQLGMFPALAEAVVAVMLHGDVTLGLADQ